MNITFNIRKLNNRSKWLTTVLTGFFLFFVLYFYKGFNIQQELSFSGHSLFFRTLCFGLLTSLSFYINEFHFCQLWSLNTTTQKLLWFSWEIFVGANLTFLLFNYFWNGTEWYLSGYTLMVREYFSVMIFPLLIVWVFTYRSEKFASVSDLLIFNSDNGKHQFKVNPDSLLCLKADDNYVEVQYLSRNDLKVEIIRNTLKTLEQQHRKNALLVRCHRGFVVNTNQIKNIRKINGQTFLDLGYELIIPVSKKYTSIFADKTT